MILAGDIGGTNTRLALVEMAGDRLKLAVEATYPSRGHGSLEAVLRRFVSEQPHPVGRACFGVAGPVRHGRCETTNLPWVVDARHLSRE